MKGLLTDCRHAIRLHLRTFGTSLIAVSVLAAGIAFVGTFVSLYVDLILRPHPGFSDSGSIATVGQNSGRRLVGLPFILVQRMADEMASIEAAISIQGSSALIGDDQEEVGIELVSEQFFEGLRPRLRLGRGFSPDEHSTEAAPVAVISHSIWQRRFGGDPNVLGTTIEITWDPRTGYTNVETVQSAGGQEGMLLLGGEPAQKTTEFRIVGVMADTVAGLSQRDTAIWVPLDRAFSLFIANDERLRGFGLLGDTRTYVRKSSGVTTAAVLNEIEARYADEEFMFNQNARLDAIDGVVRDINVQRDANRQLQMFLAGSVLLALVASANVSLFLLARAPGRRRELGIRMAVGAPIRRLARQLASEAALLVLAAGILGLLLSLWLSSFIRGLALLRGAEWRHVTLLDWRVLCLIGAFLLVLTLLVSLAPIVGLKRLGIAMPSRLITSRASPPQRIAGTIQIIVAGALSGAAVAFGWHLGSLVLGDPGYELTNRYVARVMIPELSLDDLRNSRAPLEIARQREIIESIPGVFAASFSSIVPGEGLGGSLINIPDPDDPSIEVSGRRGHIDSRYIELLGLRLLHGRAPEPNERDVVLVNQTLARLRWGRENVVGEPLSFSIPYAGENAQVIGVLEDLSFEHPSAAIVPMAFSTSPNLSTAFGNLVVETGLSASALQQAFDRLSSSGGIEFELSDVQSLRVVRNNVIAPDRARGLLTIATAILVVCLSVIGYYGTQRYLVAAGRREYAIRASLGAGPMALGNLVLRRGLSMSLPGLLTGGFLAFIVVAFLRGEYIAPEVSPGIVTISVVVGLAVTLFAASIGPARQARLTEPAPLLRQD